MRTISVAVALGVAVATNAATASAVSAQNATRATSGSLASIDSLIARSHFREASYALDQWELEHTKSITPAQRATALLLRGRMTLSADSARPYYIQLSIGYPSSPEAPIAFMKLGQMAMAANDTARALTYFRRVVSDYPMSPLHDNAVSAVASITPRKTTTTAPSDASSASRNNARADDATGAYALQVAGYKDYATAMATKKKLDKLGFDARIVSIPGSSLARIRVGRFASTRATDDLMRRLRAAGFEAIVVDDARSETPRIR